MIIGICVTETKYVNYPKWIREGCEGLELIELSAVEKNQHRLPECQGLLLTGGIDMHPGFNEPQLEAYPNQPVEWNRSRDQFELELLEQAFRLKMPVLGVCRGLQLVNIALGGTLIPDLEAAGKTDHRSREGIDFVHTVSVTSGTLLSGITCISSGTVNSAHHQAIGRLASDLQVNCMADEGIIEGIEWKDQTGRSPLLCVQWHPERMEQKEINPLSQNLKEWFWQKAEKFKS